MKFKLTKDLITNIIYAMENNEDKLYLDLETQELVPSNQIKSNGQNIFLDNNLIELPNWSSRDGFALMLSFAQSLPNSNIKKELLAIINSHQKGIFKKFKEILSKNPELLASWYNYKEEKMSKVVKQWYSQLHEQEETEIFDTSDLLIEDFSFSSDFDNHQYFISTLDKIEDPNKKVIIAYDPMQSFSGFISYKIIEEQKTALIFGYYVNKNYRRLGLFTKMLENLIQILKKEGIFCVNLPITNEQEYLKKSFSSLTNKPIASIYNFEIK